MNCDKELRKRQKIVDEAIRDIPAILEYGSESLLIRELAAYVEGSDFMGVVCDYQDVASMLLKAGWGSGFMPGGSKVPSVRWGSRSLWFLSDFHLL